MGLQQLSVTTSVYLTGAASPSPLCCTGSVSAAPHPAAHHHQVRADGCTVAGLSVSPEADGALAGELGPGAVATGCIGVTPMGADVAGILKRIRGAVCEGRDIETQ